MEFLKICSNFIFGAQIEQLLRLGFLLHRDVRGNKNINEKEGNAYPIYRED